MTASEITDAVLEGKTLSQVEEAMDVQAAILAALRNGTARTWLANPRQPVGL
jgi:hypothetical protein